MIPVPETAALSIDVAIDYLLYLGALAVCVLVLVVGFVRKRMFRRSQLGAGDSASPDPTVNCPACGARTPSGGDACEYCGESLPDGGVSEPD